MDHTTVQKRRKRTTKSTTTPKAAAKSAPIAAPPIIAKRHGDIDTIFHLSSQHGQILKQYFDSLRHMLKRDVNFVFNETGIAVSYADDRKSIVIVSKLHSHEFESYSCEQRISAGIDISKLHKIIKSVQSNEIMTMHIERTKPGTLVISTFNTATGCQTVYSYELIEEVADEELELPDFEFPRSMRVLSQPFQKKIHDMETYGMELVEIQSIRNTLILRNYHQTVSPMEVTFTGKIRVLKKQKEQNNLSNEPVYVETDEISDKMTSEIYQGVFNVKTISELVKKPGICDEMTLYIRNDLPLLIEYNVSNIGYLRIFLCPVGKDKLLAPPAR